MEATPLGTRRVKMFCAGLQKQDSNQSLEEAIEIADPNYYPNLHAVVRVLLTIPVGSVPCERSFSDMTTKGKKAFIL
jgi:hypothetical protein